MAGKNGQKKRFWADEEKRLICAQALAPGVSVAQVARRHAMNGNLIFKWLKVARFSPATGQTPDAPGGGGVFLPVQISGSTIDQRVDDTTVRTAGPASAPVLAHRVDITLSDGRRVVVEGPTALSSVAGLVQGVVA
jgi:transposase